MTIYDADFLAEQGQYPGVNDTVAESHAEIQKVPEDSDVSQDHIVDQDKESEKPSEKELNFKALRESIANEKTERESERRRYEEEIQFLRSQMQKGADSDQISRKNSLDDIPDDDIPTAGKVRQAMEEMHSKYEQELTALKYENLENRARLQYSDYNEVMEKYSIPLLRTDQDFAMGFQNAQNPAEYAYKIGKMVMGSQMQKPMEAQNSNNAERIIENARKPGTLSSARGGQQNLSKSDYYASLSDAEFASLVGRNLEQT